MGAQELKRKVEAFYELGSELSNVIEKGYQVIKSIEDGELKNLYKAELDPLIWELNALNVDLLDALEEYFIAERSEGLPTDLSMRALYRDLKA